jgi:hypothetical protein
MPATVSPDGSLVQNNQKLAKLGLFDVTDPTQIKKVGGNRMTILSNGALKRRRRPTSSPGSSNAPTSTPRPSWRP